MRPERPSGPKGADTGPGIRPGETRRIRVSAEELSAVAARCGVESPLVGVDQGVTPRGSWGARLGVVGDPARGSAQALASLLDKGLVARGGRVDPGLAGALALWHSSRQAVEFDVLLDSGTSPPSRVASWHRRSGQRVVCLSAAAPTVIEMSWMSTSDWWNEIARVAVIAPRGSAAVPQSSAWSALDLPWELLLGVSHAFDSGRPDLAGRMVAEHRVPIRAGGDHHASVPLDNEQALRALRALASSGRARLHAVVLGSGVGGWPRAGVIEWVLHDEQWWELTPYVCEGAPRARMGRVGPPDLPARVMALLAQMSGRGEP